MGRKCLALLGANASRRETTHSVTRTSQIRGAKLFDVGPGNDEQNQPLLFPLLFLEITDLQGNLLISCFVRG